MSLLGSAIKTAVISSLGANLARGRSPIVAALIMLLVSRAFNNRAEQPNKEEPKGAEQAQGGGLSDLIEKFRHGGLEEVIKSWIGVGPNKPVSPQQLHLALGPETVSKLEHETGLPQDDLLRQLSQTLPQVIDELTPGGKLPKDGDLVPDAELVRHPAARGRLSGSSEGLHQNIEIVGLTPASEQMHPAGPDRKLVQPELLTSWRVGSPP